MARVLSACHTRLTSAGAFSEEKSFYQSISGSHARWPVCDVGHGEHHEIASEVPGDGFVMFVGLQRNSLMSA